MKKSKRLNHYIRLACLTGALFCYSASAFAEVLPNIQLPENGKWIMGGSGIINEGGKGTFNNNTMNISQNGENAVIKWGKFSIGSIATVNFERQGGGNFNILNYDAGGTMSQIRGTLKAENGNVFIVNPAGVFIGNSAQVDVGSLYVSNKKLNEDVLGNFNGTASSINNMFASDQPATPAELMSLGHINATEVTFDGSRIVLDTELLTTGGLEHPMEAKNIHIKTDDSNKVVIGYNAYDNTNKYFQTEDQKNEVIADVNGADFTKANGYMWVRDLEQLQAINTNKSGNYALRNGIGAISTKDTTFVPIGDADNPFTGKFDGLAGNVDGIDFAIFDLHVTGAENQNNLGLFGVTEGAQIRNVLLTGGEVTGTGDNIGVLVGSANNTTIENVRNSINVSGIGTNSENIGGIVGKVEDAAGKGATKISDILNTGDIQGFANVGGVVGGIDGDSARASISNAENIGRVQGIDTTNEDNTTYSHDIGGIAGSAANADISDVENNLQIVGGYNVGGIVGSGANVSIKDAINNADVTASGYTTEAYKYHSNNYDTNGNWKENYQSGNTTIEIPEESTPNVNIANIGGIIGSAVKSSIGDEFGNSNVINYGNVKSIKTGANDSDPYNAGNVGGIAGRAEDTNIYNVENKENEIYGAHNVGGIAGYFGNSDNADDKFIVSGAVNNGGEIMATGARYKNKFVYERVRPAGVYSNEPFIIGNMGGIAGYMYGDASYISQSGNRGNVHSQIIKDQSNILDSSKAANVGGIVGKIDRSNTKSKTDLIDDKGNIKTGVQAAIYDCYNRGDIQGYTGVGGVVGMMYNGEVVTTDNSGTVTSTRISTGSVDPLNMGGIVGDTTEDTEAHAFIYNVHNDGTIGSSDFSFYGRHVGGVVGRLSGDIEKSYNTGAIYNAYSNTGGIVGYSKGNGNELTNVFNTGNITVYNVDTDQSSAVGGIVGGERGKLTINNAYNLGTLRSFRNKINESIKDNTIGGIIGNSIGTTNISNVYTLGNLYAYDGSSTLSGLGAIYGSGSGSGTVSNAYYITPEISVTSGKDGFRTLTDDNLNGATSINFTDRTNWSKYTDFGFSDASLVLVDDAGFTTTENGAWRIYNYKFNDGTGDTYIATTPILNVFMPKSQGYFGSNSATGKTNRTNIHSVQYGTAYNPLLTIINATTPKNTEGLLNGLNTISFDWNKINPDRSASFAVFNGNLSISDFNTQGNLYGGTLYAKGNLSINNAYSETEVDGKKYINSGDVLLGSGAKLYGSTINVTSGGQLVNYGEIRSTGQVAGGSAVTLSAEGDVEIIGEVTSNGEENVVVPNIGRYPVDPGKTTANLGEFGQKIVNDIAKSGVDMPSVGEYYSRRFEAESIKGDISITSEKGDVNVLLGVAQKGHINSSQNLNITGQNVYVDSDLSIKGSLALNATDKTVLDITNIGAVNTNADGQEKAREAFVTHFKNIEEGDTNTNTISFSNVDNALITMDLWDTDSFKLSDHTTLGDALRKMKVDDENNGFDLFHIWIDNAKALQGINNRDDSSTNGKNIITYNFALKNNIDAAELSDKFRAIGVAGDDGKTNVFSGKFNGRGNTIVGLDVDNDSAGLFSVVGIREENNKTYTGKVSNLNIYSSSFKGGTVGAVAGINKGEIDNVTTFGNRVNSYNLVSGDEINNSAPGVTGGISSAGGITGINNGTIRNASVNDAVATSVANSGTKNSFAGGIAGVNTADAAKIDNSVANSDITSTEGAHALGGVVGINSKNAVVDTVRSLGIVNGTYSVGNNNVISDNVGGIAGINEGGAQITKAYNVAHVSGGSNVGGIVGKLVGSNTNTTADKYDLQEVVSAGDIYSTKKDADGKNIAQNVGGIVGFIDNSNHTHTYINSGRNTGEVTGNENVGGLVGNNGVGSNLQNVINDANANITGNTNVGGLVGNNFGNINAANSNLVNEGRVYGVTNVGGIAGVNSAGGVITNTNSNITLYVKDNAANAQYFGGVAGSNEGTITSATNTGNVNAKDAIYVGGITGENTEKGQITGAGNSNSGTVFGENYVGGVVGVNRGEISGQDDNPTEIRNDGYVHATAGGAGGLIGYNYEDLMHNVTLINGGVVSGTRDAGTGGIIGVNEGNIQNTNLIGELGAVVVGEKNVGGLIGINYGNVAGGRDDDGNYYAHQIYNNGKVIGGTTEFKETLGADDDPNEWTQIGEAENIKGYYKITEDNASSDIGGLVGSNDTKEGKTGSLIAGYNTGYVEGGTNVGGIVGNNAAGAAVDQVFNAGTVEGTAAVGKVVGNNNGTVTNAYDVDSDLKGIIGKGNPVGEETEGFWTTYGDGKTAGKENYGTNKLLSVFLTKINFVPEYENAFKDFVYNAHKQSIIVKAEERVDVNDYPVKDEAGNQLYDVNVYKNDGLGNTNSETLLGHFVNASGDEKAAHSLADLINTKVNKDGTIEGEGTGDLLSGTSFTDAGTYNIFNTKQIDVNGQLDEKNPNNLGFDVTEIKTDNNTPIDKVTVNKAQISLTLKDIWRIYGDAKIIYGDAGLTKDGSYSFNFEGKNITLNDTMLSQLENLVKVTKPTDKNKPSTVVDGALKDADHTKDVGNYNWSLQAILDATNALSNNYELIKADGDKFNEKGVYTANSHVLARTLTLSDFLAQVTYGDKVTDWKALLSNGGKLNDDNGIVYGDDVSFTINNATLKAGTAYATSSNGRNTADVLPNNGTYKDSLDITATLTGDQAGNYVLAPNIKGDIQVNPKAITIDLNNIERVYGTVGDNYGIADNVKDSLVNGDKDKANITFKVTSDGGLVKNGTETNNVNPESAPYKWTAAVDFGDQVKTGNYAITYTGGNSVVTPKPLTLSEILAEIVYGTKNINWDNAVQNTAKLNDVVYGDNVGFTYSTAGAQVITGSDYVLNAKGRDTADVGLYEKSIQLTNVKLTGDKAGNYILPVTNATGTIKVTPATLHIKVDDKTMQLGGTEPIYTGSITGNTNGDELTDIFGESYKYKYQLQDSSLTDKIGKHQNAIGIVINGKYYELESDFTFSSNYTYKYHRGTLTVTDTVDPTDPTNPDNPYSPDNPNNWQAEDKYPWYQWDKQRNERERKAEVHFVDGGMHVEA